MTGQVTAGKYPVQHYPRCNRRCHGDSHYLDTDGVLIGLAVLAADASRALGRLLNTYRKKARP